MIHMIRRAASTAAIACACLLITACASTLQYKPEYVSAGLAAPKVQGHAVVVMDGAQQAQTITAHPTSYTGSATTITEPVGQILREAALKVFGVAFSEGAEVAEVSKPGGYNVALKLNNFSYKYDQLSSLGFEIKPKVTVAIDVDAIAPDGHKLFSKTYQRTDYLVSAYVISGNPPEKINQALHMAVTEIFRDIVDDVAKTQGS